LAVIFAASAGVAVADTLTVLPLDAQALTTNNGTSWTVDPSATSLNAKWFPSISEEGRVIMDFNLGGIPTGSTITSAQFNFRINQLTYNSTAFPQIRFFGSPGNGVLDVADVSNTTAALGLSQAITGTGPYNTAFDVPYVQSRAGARLGVMAWQETGDLQSSFFSTEGAFASADRPQLTITYTPPAPPANPNAVYVSGRDDAIREYTPAGSLVRTITVPWASGSRPATEDVRGVAVDDLGRLHAFNGTFSPTLSSSNSAAATSWTHRNAPGMDVTGNVSHGDVAAFGSYVFAPDQQVGGGTNGIVRFDTRNNVVRRFAGAASTSADVSRVSRGLDGLLYAVTGNTDSATIKVYNPYTLALVKTVTLAQSVRDVAVNAAGEIYGTNWSSGTLYKFTAAGTVVGSRVLGSQVDAVDLAADGTVVVGSLGSGVWFTNESLAAPTQILSGTTSNDFVTFKNPARGPGWKVSASGNWSTAANWQGAVPNGPGAIANFSPANTGTIIVDVASNVTVGTLNIDEDAGHYVFTGSGTVTLDSTAGPAMINVVRGEIPLSPRYTLADDAIIRFSGSTSMQYNSQSKIDLTTRALLWDYDGAHFDLNDLLARGYNNGRWNGTGGVMTSSVAAADTTGATSVGYAEARDLGITTFRGTAVDDTTLIYAYTWVGDANLDGVVNALDVARMDPAGTDWSHGDFNYDHVVNADDWMLLNLGLTYGTNPINLAVPEPTALTVTAASLALTTLRRRTRNVARS
jgi:hypothetical protein